MNENYQNEAEEEKIYKEKQKECRLCAFTHVENIKIFKSTSNAKENGEDDYNDDDDATADLLRKIITVYPIVLYEHDPFPQHICLQCFNNVNSRYEDMQKILIHQQKLLINTQEKEAKYKYSEILDTIEISNRDVLDSIESRYSVQLHYYNTTDRLRMLPMTDPLEDETLNSEYIAANKSKLQTNGYTEKKFKPKHEWSLNHEESSYAEELKANVEDEEVADMEEEEEAEEEEEQDIQCSHCEKTLSTRKELAEHQLQHLQLPVTKVFQKQYLPKHLRRGRLVSFNSSKAIRCLNCWSLFNDNKAILQHWTAGECDFYCFICGKEFTQSPKLLREHVPKMHGISYRSAKAQCTVSRVPQFEKIEKPAIQEHIIEREEADESMELLVPQHTVKIAAITPTTKLPTMPTMTTHPSLLRKKKRKFPYATATKHPDGTYTCNVCYEHFTNFRSSNSHMRKHKPVQDRLTMERTKPEREPQTYYTTSSTKNPDGTYTCNICSRVFSNMFSTNSHMRKHKKTNTFASNKSNSADMYSQQDDPYTPHQSTSSSTVNSSKATQNRMHHNQNSTSNATRPTYQVIRNNGGIKRKIVQKRADFEANVPMHYKYGSNMDGQYNAEATEEARYMPENPPHTTTTTTSIKQEYSENNDDDNNTANDLECYTCHQKFSEFNEFQMHTMYAHNLSFL